jgi:subtilisin-like proprotein convertase family protein
MRSVSIHVQIRHSYPGDLVVDLIPPRSIGGPALEALLRNRKAPLGTWTLEVTDATRVDEGHIEQFTVEYDI